MSISFSKRFVMGLIVFVFASSSCGKPSSPSVTVTPLPVHSAAVESALALSDSMEPRVPSGFLAKDMEEELRQHPNNLRARIMVAQVYKQSGEFRKAIDHLETALTVDPAQSDAYCVLGDVMYELGLMHIALALELSFDDNGVPIVHPSEITREIFRQALIYYNQADKYASNSISSETVVFCDIDVDFYHDQMERAALYGSGQGDVYVYTADVLKISLWLQVAEGQISTGNTAHFDEIANQLIVLVEDSDRADKEYLRNVIHLSSGILKFLTYCQSANSRDLHLMERSSVLASIISDLANTNFHPADTFFETLVHNDCEQPQALQQIWASIGSYLGDHDYPTASTLFVLVLQKSLIGHDLSQKDLMVTDLNDMRSFFVMSEELSSELDQLIEDCENADNDSDWTTVSNNIDQWLNRVAQYSLTLSGPQKVINHPTSMAEMLTRNLLPWVETLNQAIQATNRSDSQDLLSIVSLKSALTKYETTCQAEMMGDDTPLVLIIRSEQVPKIIDGIAHLGYRLEDDLLQDNPAEKQILETVTKNYCFENLGQWQALEDQMVKPFTETQNRLAAFNLYNLVPIGANFVSVMEGAISIPATQGAVLTLLRSLEVELLLSDALQQDLHELTGHVESVFAGEMDWNVVKAEAENWLQEVLVYSLTLP